MHYQRARQQLYQCIRGYFAEQHVSEVETPIMDKAGNTDPAIDSFLTQHADHAPAWLRTSPEFFHKRLLAKGSGSIFEIAKVFRQGEVSRKHHPEFSMLEYYRVGFSEFQLMDCMTEWITRAHAEFNQPTPKFARVRFQDWFYQHLQIDPITVPMAQLQQIARSLGAMGDLSRDAALDLIRSHLLEPAFDRQIWTFVYDFPASQAALAALNPDLQTARRFELFGGGFELANGYFELTDAKEQRRRFNQDLAIRNAKNAPLIAIDEALLSALELGLPSCAGVALGLDRLLMALLAIESIDELHEW
jgi:elongation factor P--(R)-beta-lysine ligase